MIETIRQKLKPSKGASPAHALVTGGAGFIGSHLCEALLERGYRVTAMDDLSTGNYENVAHLAENPRFLFVQETILDRDATARLVSASDVVFHLAAAVGVMLTVDNPLHVLESNALGTHSVLTAASKYGRKLLIASTSEVYGKSPQVPFREDDDCLIGPTSKSRWSYSCSKALDEFFGLAYHRQTGLPVVIFRLFNTVGPRQRGRYGMVVPRFVQQALRGEKLTVYGDGQQSRCFCDIEDAVRAIVGLSQCEDAVGSVFNVGTTHRITILDLARKVLQLVGEETGRTQERDSVDDDVAFVPYHTAYGDGFEDMPLRAPDTSRIRAATGWEPRVALDETLRRVIRYFQPAQAAIAVPQGSLLGGKQKPAFSVR
jgi:UDP-glucose 4-epimerase